METVYIVAIGASAVVILALAVIFRKRLTRLALKFKDIMFELEAPPDKAATGPQFRHSMSRGVVLDKSKFKGATVKVSNAPFTAHKAEVEDTKFDVSESSESPPAAEEPDG